MPEIKTAKQTEKKTPNQNKKIKQQDFCVAHTK
jgi:hypothetical protein